jgi:hypothetical protein
VGGRIAFWCALLPSSVITQKLKWFSCPFSPHKGYFQVFQDPTNTSHFNLKFYFRKFLQSPLNEVHSKQPFHRLRMLKKLVIIDQTRGEGMELKVHLHLFKMCIALFMSTKLCGTIPIPYVYFARWMIDNYPFTFVACMLVARHFG